MNISAFSAADLSLVRATLKERFGHDVVVQEVETEVRVSQADRELTQCPALYWKEDGCAFVIAKAGEANYRSMFFYSVKDRYGTGREEYDNLGDCVILTLKVQEDIARQRTEETGNN